MYERDSLLPDQERRRELDMSILNELKIKSIRRQLGFGRGGDVSSRNNKRLEYDELTTIDNLLQQVEGIAKNIEKQTDDLVVRARKDDSERNKHDAEYIKQQAQVLQDLVSD